MKIALIGRTEMLYNTGAEIIKAGFEIPLIITAKEAPEYNKTANDFAKFANEIGAVFLNTAQINNEENIEQIKSAGQMDLALSVNYINVIKQAVIDLFPLGILNAHGGDLPRYRGNACQAWAIINGEEKIGLCIHKMIGGELDSGDIISRRYLPIDINTKIGDVQRWMTKLVPQMFVEAVTKLKEDSNFVLEIQSKNAADALRCYPRTPEDNKIYWSNSNEQILRLINASSEPYSGAFCEYDNQKMIVWDAEIFEDDEQYLAVPGQVAQIRDFDESVVVISGQGKLKIKEIEINDQKTKPNRIIKTIRKRLK